MLVFKKAVFRHLRNTWMCKRGINLFCIESLVQKAYTDRGTIKALQNCNRCETLIMCCTINTPKKEKMLKVDSSWSYYFK